MGTLALHRGFHLSGTPACRSQRAPAHRQGGILRRILAAIDRWDQRRIEREAERFIAAHGARFTDDVERQLIEHLAGRRGFTR